MTDTCRAWRLGPAGDGFLRLRLRPETVKVECMKVLFAGGGTLGPVTPLLAVAHELKKTFSEADIVFVGTPDGPERRLIEKAGFRFLSLTAAKLHRHTVPRNLALPFRLGASFFKALRIIRAEDPDIVVGAGGYTSVPMGLAAKVRGKRLLIHQQDVVPSLSNRILARVADAITVTFEKSMDDFPSAVAELTGNPVRPVFESGDRTRGLELLGFDDKRPVVLVTGGGTGSVRLNEAVLRALPDLTLFADVAHITGLGKSFGGSLPLTHPERYRRMDFVGEDIVHIFAAADVVIARAGLATSTELAALKRPVILVPIADSHQEANAAFIVAHGGGILLEERDLSSEKLTAVIRHALSESESLEAMGEALHHLFVPGARKAVVNRIKELLGKRP